MRLCCLKLVQNQSFRWLQRTRDSAFLLKTITLTYLQTFLIKANVHLLRNSIKFPRSARIYNLTKSIRLSRDRFPISMEVATATTTTKMTATTMWLTASTTGMTTTTASRIAMAKTIVTTAAAAVMTTMKMATKNTKEC